MGIFSPGFLRFSRAFSGHFCLIFPCKMRQNACKCGCTSTCASLRIHLRVGFSPENPSCARAHAWAREAFSVHFPFKTPPPPPTPPSSPKVIVCICRCVCLHTHLPLLPPPPIYPTYWAPPQSVPKCPEGAFWDCTTLRNSFPKERSC